MDLKSLQDHFDTHHTETKGALEGVKEKLAELSDRQLEIEQKGVRRGGDYAAEPVSLGAKFIAEQGLKDFAAAPSRNGGFQLQTKATLTSSTANAAGAMGAGLNPTRDPNITPLPRRRPLIRSLLTVLPMSGSSVEVVDIKGRNNNAAVVAEGAAKPGSDIQLGLRTVQARTIAHWIKASRQILSDLPQAEGLIDTELLDGLALNEEVEILYGDGTGEHLEGLVPGATAYASPISVIDENMLDIVGQALLQSALAYQPATGIILHDADWTRITLLKDAEGRYILGPPGSVIEKRLWGVPVVTTQAMEVDQFLVGNFTNAATLYDRWEARVELGFENDDFTKNLVTILAEERVALAKKQPNALTYGAFGNEE